MKSIKFTTSQFVHIEYELAPTAIRVLSSFIDILTLILYRIVISSILGIDFFQVILGKLISMIVGTPYFSVDNTSTILAFIFLDIPFIFYSPIMEYLTNGKSLGKVIFGIRVVKSNGESAGLRECFVRWIFRLIDIWIGFLGFLGILLSSTSSRRQRLGDLMADTVVIKIKSSQSYNLADILNIKNSENHTVTYPNVIRFSDEDMMLLKTTILRVTRYPNDKNRQFAIEMAQKTAELIQVDLPERRLEFLRTCLQDYIVLTR